MKYRKCRECNNFLRSFEDICPVCHSANPLPGTRKNAPGIAGSIKAVLLRLKKIKWF